MKVSMQSHIDVRGVLNPNLENLLFRGLTVDEVSHDLLRACSNPLVPLLNVKLLQILFVLEDRMGVHRLLQGAASYSNIKL